MIKFGLRALLFGVVLVAPISASLMNHAAYSFAVGEECDILLLAQY